MEEKETLRMRDNNGEYGTSVPLNREDDCMETEGSISDSSPGSLGISTRGLPANVDGKLALRRGGGTLAREPEGAQKR